MSLHNYIMATAGHVDHGKSALVTALTGVDPDRLPEEKARGITIDLGFAHLELPGRESADSKFLVGVVDVPGHEDFVKNMVAGVGSIDLALLVVAANDGWMPQTEEHLQILAYLGVNRVVVALAKIDLVRDQRSAVAQIREKLRDTPFAAAPIVPTSALDGDSVESLKSTLAAVFAETPLPANIGKPRLPVDRVFTLRGIGTVVTGTLTGGNLYRGEGVVIQPSGKGARIRTIQSHNQNLELSSPGTRTALNLPDITSDEIKRGDTVTIDLLGGASRVVDVCIEISRRATHRLKSGSRVRIHHGSGNVAARVVIYKNQEVGPGEHAIARLRLEAPSFLFTGDRFIVRDWAEQTTLAGGAVLDPDSRRRSLAAKNRIAFLNARAQSQDVSNFVASQIEFDGVARSSGLLLKSRFGAGDISAAISQLTSEGRAKIVKEFVFDTAHWHAWCNRASDAIDAHHRARPEQGGLLLSDLAKTLQQDSLDGQFFDAFLVGFCGCDFVRVGPAIRRVAHRATLSTHLHATACRLRSALGARPFDPPSRKELAPDLVSQQALRFLIETGEALEISRDIVMATDNVEEATKLISQFICKHGPATVSELRQSLSSSRRVVVPLLERLDREGMTVRRDNRRLLGPANPQVTAKPSGLPTQPRRYHRFC